MIIPTMKDLYSRKTGCRSYRIGSAEIFVNFNRFMRPFIRVNKYPDRTRTFPFSKNGYSQAIAYMNTEIHGSIKKEEEDNG